MNIEHRIARLEGRYIKPPLARLTDNELSELIEATRLACQTDDDLPVDEFYRRWKKATRLELEKDLVRSGEIHGWGAADDATIHHLLTDYAPS